MKKEIYARPDAPARDIFAANVRRLRAERGLSQRDLAALAGYDAEKGEASISAIESQRGGNRGNCLLSTVDRLAQAFALTAADMLTLHACPCCAGKVPSGMICGECGLSGPLRTPAAPEPVIA